MAKWRVRQTYAHSSTVVLTIVAMLGMVMFALGHTWGAVIGLIGVAGVAILLATAPNLRRAATVTAVTAIAALAVGLGAISAATNGTGSGFSAGPDETETRERVETATDLWQQGMDVADSYGDSGAITSARTTLDASYLLVNISLQSGHHLRGEVTDEATEWEITAREANESEAFDGRTVTADFAETAAHLGEENPWGLSFNNLFFDAIDFTKDIPIEAMGIGENDPVLRFHSSDNERPIYAETRVDGTPAGTWIDTDDAADVMGSVEEALTVAGYTANSFEVQEIDVSPMSTHVDSLAPEGYSSADRNGGVLAMGMVDGQVMLVDVPIGGFPRVDLWGTSSIEPLIAASDLDLGAITQHIEESADGAENETTWRLDAATGKVSAQTGSSGSVTEIDIPTGGTNTDGPAFAPSWGN